MSLSGSKAAHTIDGVSPASGSITTLQGVLKDNADNNRNFCFLSGDVEVFAGNTEKKSKASCVKEDRTTPLNVATNVVFIQSDPATNYQSLSHLSPRNWLNKADDSPSDIISYDDELSSNTFAPYRFMIQEDLIQSISKHVSVSENEKVDPVQKIIDVQTVDNLKKICLNCHCVIDKRSEKCLVCGCTSKNYPSREILYGDITEHHPKENPNIKIGEIIDVNPNSH